MEFAFILPLALAMILWLISSGLMIYSQGIVASAAREVARCAAIHGTAEKGKIYKEAGEVLSIVLPNNPSFALSDETVSVTVDDDVVRVTITYDYMPLVDFNALKTFVRGGGDNEENSSTLCGVAYFRKEHPE